MTDTREHVARAIWQTGFEESWDTVDGHTQELTRDQAQAAIEAHEKALEAEGLVIVPREPSEDMIAGAREALPGAWPENIWQAMLAALEGNDAD